MIYPLQLRRVQASAAIKEALFTATHKLCYLKTIGHIQLSLSNSVLSSLFLTQGMHWFRCSKRKHRQVCCNMKVGVESNNILTNMTYIQECATCQIKNTSDIVYKKHVTLKPPKKREKILTRPQLKIAFPSLQYWGVSKSFTTGHWLTFSFVKEKDTYLLLAARCAFWNVISSQAFLFSARRV